MARIKNKTQYPLDQLISVDDYLLGTDADSLFATKSYSIGDLTDFVVSYITQLPEVSYESISESGLKAAGNITTIIGDYDDSGFETKVTISDSAKTIVLNADTYIRTSSDIQIGGATAFFTVLTSAGLTATRTLQSPDAGGYIGLSVNGAKADSSGDMAVSAASLIASGIVELATIAETDTGTDATRAMTPAGLKGSALQTKVDDIEALADVTDATNVNAAGATMNADTTLAGYGYFLDEDDMTSDDATKTVSQQSVKKFVEDSTQLGQLYATVVKTANYTVTTNDYSVICTTNSFTVALPAAATAGLGKRYEIKNSLTNSGSIIVDGNGTETVEGALTQTLTTGESITIVCDGSNWHII